MNILSIFKDSSHSLHNNLISSKQALQEKISMVAVAIFTFFAMALTFCFYKFTKKVYASEQQKNKTNLEKDSKINEISQKKILEEKKPLEIEKSSNLKNKPPKTTNLIYLNKKQNKEESHFNNQTGNNLSKDDDKQQPQKISKKDENNSDKNKSGLDEKENDIDQTTKSSQATQGINANNKVDLPIQLIQIGDRLKLAFAETKVFSLHINLIKVLSDFHSFIGDSFSINLNFVRSSYFIIEKHKKALGMLNKNRDIALKLINYANAEEVVKDTEEFTEKFKNLINLSIKVLETISKNQSVSDERKKEIIKIKNDFSELLKISTDSEYKDSLKKIDDNLAETDAKLKNLQAESKSLEKATFLLEAAIHKMINMYVTYERTRLFWLNKKDELKDTLSILRGMNDQTEQKNLIEKSQIIWTALHQQYKDSYDSLQKSRKRIEHNPFANGM